MEITRDVETVNQYHVDARIKELEEKKGVPTTKFHIDIQPVVSDKTEKKTTVLVIFQFMVVLNQYVISGTLTQRNQILGRLVENPRKEFTEDEKRLLAEPLLDMLNRLTYDVTEIIFDAPGVDLRF